MQNFILCVLILTSLCACQKQKTEIYNLNGLTMGTSYSVKIVPDNSPFNKNNIHKNIDKILFDINQSMSTYIENSEISRFNQSKNTSWLNISEDLYYVIQHANQISLQSNGAFDITVSPLVNIWGFGPDPFTRKIPTEDTITLIKKNTGYKKLNVDTTTNRISKTIPELSIDLSGIAKGFAVDKIAQFLDDKGFKNYLVEIGGEIIANGLNSKHQVWQIGIEQPNPIKRNIQSIIGLKNIAMASSGDYRNYFEHDGKRYSHTIDPESGKPITHTLASVTVLHASAMYADALATAFMVTGPEKSLGLANQLGIPIYMIIKNDSGFEERYNDAFKPYINH